MTREPIKVKRVRVHAVKGNGGVEVSFHPLLTSALHGGEWPASHPGRFIELEDNEAQSRSGWFGIDRNFL